MSDWSLSEEISDFEFEDEELQPIQRCLGLSDIYEIQSRTARQVADALGMDFDQCFLLLQDKRWQKEELIDEILHGTAIKYEPGRLTQVSSVVCPICTERAKGLNLGCGHSVCLECFDAHIDSKLEDQRIIIKCPGSSACKRIIGPSIAAARRGNYTKTCAQLYLKAKPQSYAGCPSPDCDAYYELGGPLIECGCGATLCGTCGYYNHEATPCEIVSQWLRKLEDDKQLLLKCTTNSKPCPKCRVIIEKQVGGCNHMTCSCGYEFCWQCLGEFVSYGHQCARFTEQESRKSSMAKRFAHYAPRYASNLANAEYHASVHTTSEALDGIHSALASSSRLIAWTFVLLYYATHTNNRLLLEDNLVNLEESCEKLAEMSKQHQESASLTRYVNERRRILSQYVLDTSWKFQPF